MSRMNRQRSMMLLEHVVTRLILLGLFLNALHGALCKGFLPKVISTKLGPSRGGTLLRVHVIGNGLDDFRPHYLRVNNWHPVKAANQSVVSNGAIEDEFVMPSFPSTSKGIVRLSYSLDGVRYIKAGEFIYYDGEELATTALHPADIEGVWDLQNSIFPCSDTYKLLSMSFTPNCRDEDGVITEARYPIAYVYARQPIAKLSIHCPIESPRRITHISLNGQDYVAVEDPFDEHRRLVDYILLDQMANPRAPSPGSKSSTSPPPQGSAPNLPPPSTTVNSPPSSSVATTLPAGSLPKAGRQLGSNMPVCTSRDTGMGLSILVMFPTPTAMGPIKVTTDVAGSFTGVGGPMTYLVSVLVGSPGSYKLTSIVPSCAGITPPLSFNVSGPASPQYSYVSSTFATGGYIPGTSNAETMFATAMLWARKLGPRPIKLSNLGEQVEIASQALHKILEQHGPLTVTDCWNRASQLENHGLKSKRHMKMMLRWMRERRVVRIICQHSEGGNPNDREFLFTVVPPKVDREPRVTDTAATPAE